MNVKDRDLLFQIAGRITLLRIEGFMDADEWEASIKLIRKELELERMKQETIDSNTTNKV